MYIYVCTYLYWTPTTVHNSTVGTSAHTARHPLTRIQQVCCRSVEPSEVCGRSGGRPSAPKTTSARGWRQPLWVTAHSGGSTQLVAHTPYLSLPAVLPWDGPFLLCLVDLLLQDLREEANRALLRRLSTPCTELWGGGDGWNWEGVQH